MFSFHKPKVYRSTTGCCICKAKSSSSRFTDSKKYEEDFIECFQLDERRTGEICNACVLLVKRWKKLPAGSDRHWRHVVDARAGPGIKSLTKFKSKNKKKMKDMPEKFDKIVKKKHIYQKSDRDRENSPTMSDEMNEEEITGNGSKGSSRSGSPMDTDEIIVTDKRLVNRENGAKNHLLSLGIFADMTYFKREVYCCGVIYKGMCGEIITEPKSQKPCSSCSPRVRQQQAASTGSGSSPEHSSASASPVHSSASTSPAHSVESGTESSSASGSSSKPVSPETVIDSSSDSGYDESSNQGLGESKLAKFVQNVAKATAIASTKSTSILYKPVAPMLAEAVRIKQMDHQHPLHCKAVVNGTGAAPANPLVDFAMHASSRQSLSN